MSIVEAAKYQITSAVYNAKDKVSNCQRSLPAFKSTVLSPRFGTIAGLGHLDSGSAYQHKEARSCRP